MELHANSSNNTIFADSEGNIAYFHANFIPKRNPKFDWTKPVDGSDPATEWQGLYTVDEAPNVFNPKGGWVYNTNDAPWNAAGADSPQQKNYPAYVDTGGGNPRGVHAIRVLSKKSDFTLETLTAAAFDPQMPALESLIPALIQAHDMLPISDPLKRKLAKPIETLKAWDCRWSAASIATTLGVLWGDELWSVMDPLKSNDDSIYGKMERAASAKQRLAALRTVTDKLIKDFGSWQVPWGEINRFQRLTGDVIHPFDTNIHLFDDTKASIPVPFTTSRWGSLATFGTYFQKGLKKNYGVYGNSFLAAVEFGEKVKARAIMVGGQSGHPSSPHFNDQAVRYANGNLREVYFYPDQLVGHTELVYHPGQ